MSFTLKHKNELYKTCYSEYFIEKYISNYFQFGIDIGASGICHTWHINHMGKNNPKTKFIGFEPDNKFFQDISTECKNLKNVKLYKKFFGRDINFKELINKNDIDITKKWFLSSDCEGDEKYLFNNKDNLNILKTCSHFCFEFHANESGISYKDILKLLLNNFTNTHKIIQTYYINFRSSTHKGPYAVFVLIKNDVYNDLNAKYVKDIIEKNRKNPQYLLRTKKPNEFQKLSQHHYIKYLN